MEPELAELGVRLSWQPIDLCRITGWPRGVVIEGAARDNALRVAREFAVKVRMPARWLDSRPAHALAIVLGDSPRGEAWRERIWSAVFEECRDIGDPAELERLARDLDLELPAELFPAALSAETETARELGVSGAPVFLLDRYPFPGIQERTVMRATIRRWLSRRST